MVRMPPIRTFSTYLEYLPPGSGEGRLLLQPLLFRRRRRRGRLRLLGLEGGRGDEEDRVLLLAAEATGRGGFLVVGILVARGRRGGEEEDFQAVQA